MPDEMDGINRVERTVKRKVSAASPLELPFMPGILSAFVRFVREKGEEEEKTATQVGGGVEVRMLWWWVEKSS